jgi:hypothetical protein
MLEFEIPVRGEADHLLYEGLPLLAPVLKELGDGAVLIGGLATAAWLTACPVGLPVRATRERVVDTVDGIMLAAACLSDAISLGQLRAHSRRSDVSMAIRWMRDRFTSAESAESRRVTRHVGSPHGGEWAMDVAARFTCELQLNTPASASCIRRPDSTA